MVLFVERKLFNSMDFSEIFLSDHNFEDFEVSYTSLNGAFWLFSGYALGTIPTPRCIGAEGRLLDPYLGTSTLLVSTPAFWPF